ncbi:MAG: response regulator [Sulfitobacter litoralis]|jgi:CheY-like chemotaxis protein|uniref:Response regulator n=3 Tax=root TaxID=1 RepID=A0A7V1A4M0_9RHOB|nr:MULTISPECIES: response regulator [Sulfitobacter]MBQ0766280.1 response regulator [Sulfitobacter litoralis]MCF7726742.1 response regulator [Sulfitobacter sp. M22]MCF7778118.1 response regulator [Sulfitobacter sp. M220]HDY94671.1 response regulator [Sulfitobacter litoralis]HDZ51716.1 response regulator [Sulfitobacter litoralis]|tara:strand:+ start:795 stop:1187 length:393 start_codon:yes stop_codon:yes gene_type:complete
MYSENTSRLAVLVVEDEPLLRMDAVDMIGDAGFKTYEACSADEAMALIRDNNDIGILFTDIDMPGSINGLKLAACVREGWPSVEILIASGVVGVTDEVMPEGSKFYSKPYVTAQIISDMKTIAATEDHSV